MRYILSLLLAVYIISVANASTCLPHRIQYGLSTVSVATHPQGLAAIYRAWLGQAKPKIAGHDYQDMICLLDRLNLKITLTDFGIKEQDINSIVNRIEGRLDFDPSYKGKEQLIELLRNSL